MSNYDLFGKMAKLTILIRKCASASEVHIADGSLERRCMIELWQWI